MNPLNLETSFIPLLTDENGQIEFIDLQFSQYGPAGQYKIVFICEGE